MPRRHLPPRLVLDRIRGSWIIRFRSIYRRTGFSVDQKGEAQAALDSMLEGGRSLAFKLRKKPIKADVHRIPTEMQSIWSGQMDGIIYFISGEGEGHPIKIGFCLTNLEKRRKSLQTGNHVDLITIAHCAGTIRMERVIHKHLKEYCIRNEWFQRSPAVMEAVEAARCGALVAWLGEDALASSI